MTVEFTKYPEARRTFEALAKQGYPEAKNLMNDVQNLKDQGLEFHAAYLILSVYNKSIEVKNRQNETKEIL